MSAKIVIKSNREKPVRNQHPWIFSGAIDEVQGNPTPGDIVTVVDKSRKFLARGYWNPKSQIQVRILTWLDEEIDEGWWHKQILRVIESRRIRIKMPWSFRLINAENDYLPGLVVDCYQQDFQQKWLVLQALTLGIDQRKEQISSILAEVLKCEGIYERSDVDVRRKEGIKPQTGILWGKEPENGIVRVDERPGDMLYVDIKRGHKTGYYLDQQDNHEIMGALASLDPQVNTILNLFSYTSSFGMNGFYTVGPNMQIVNVDSSRESLELAERNVSLNKQSLERYDFIQANVFDYLHDVTEQGEQFDIIVCDPPKFAQNAQQVERAARGYKDLNLNCFKIIKSGGYLMTFSCSGAVSADLFQKIVFGALADSGRQAQILRHLGPGDDHPVALTFPEGAYLKGLLLRVY